MKKTEKKVSAGESISPLLKTEMELLTPATPMKTRGKISRTVSDERGLGFASTTNDHQDVSINLAVLLKTKFPYLYIAECIALKDPKKDPKKPNQDSKKYVEFDISVCQRPDRSDRTPINYFNKKEATDFLVGIELEMTQRNRKDDEEKIAKAFSFSKTLKEIILIDIVKDDYVRFSRINGIIVRNDDCSWSEALGVDMRKLVHKKNMLYELIRGLNID